MKSSLHCVFVALAATWLEARALSATCPGGANHVCLYSPVDPAGSKGSQSLTLGFGVATAPSANDPDGVTNGSPSSETDQILRVFVTKGMPFPVDFGLMLGTSASGQFQQTGMHAQWTVFEGFRLPAFTVRASLLRSAWTDWSMSDERGAAASETGIRITSMDTRNWELLASWGVLGVLTPYAGLGIAEAGGERSQTQFYGLEVQAMPPFMRVGIESRSAFAKNHFMAKVSLGL